MRNRIVFALVFLALFLGIKSAFAQRSVQVMPIDAQSNPLDSSLGLPWACEVALTSASYGGSQYCDLPANSGQNTGRVYRAIAIYNPSSTLKIYLCFGSSSGCSTETTSDMMIVPPSLGLVEDHALYGINSNTTRVWFRLSSAGTVTVSAQGW